MKTTKTLLTLLVSIKINSVYAEGCSRFDHTPREKDQILDLIDSTFKIVLHFESVESNNWRVLINSYYMSIAFVKCFFMYRILCLSLYNVYKCDNKTALNQNLQNSC